MSIIRLVTQTLATWSRGQVSSEHQIGFIHWSRASVEPFICDFLSTGYSSLRGTKAQQLELYCRWKGYSRRAEGYEKCLRSCLFLDTHPPFLPSQDRPRSFDGFNMHSLENSLIDIMRAEQDTLKGKIRVHERRLCVKIPYWCTETFVPLTWFKLHCSLCNQMEAGLYSSKGSFTQNVFLRFCQC